MFYLEFERFCRDGMDSSFDLNVQHYLGVFIISGATQEVFISLMTRHLFCDGYLKSCGLLRRGSFVVF